jgi:uncharacterized damage-inducible protein DinB
MDTAVQAMNTPAFAAGFTQMSLSGLAMESQITRKVIAAVPQDKCGYRPDPKAKSALELAWHIATGEVGLLDSIADMKFAMENRYATVPATIAEILAWYDENSRRAMARVQAMAAEQLLTPVDFYGMLNLPVFNYLAIVNSHSIHHRGQLSTYLRPMGSKVPSIYGGSADEPFKG